MAEFFTKKKKCIYLLFRCVQIYYGAEMSKCMQVFNGTLLPTNNTAQTPSEFAAALRNVSFKEEDVMGLPDSLNLVNISAENVSIYKVCIIRVDSIGEEGFRYLSKLQPMSRRSDIVVNGSDIVIIVRVVVVTEITYLSSEAT